MLIAVQLSVTGIISAPGVQRAARAYSTPDDHFSAGPHCSITGSNSRRIGRAGGYPSIRTGIVSPTCTGAGRRWSWSWSLAGRHGGLCLISLGIIAVAEVGISAPNNYFTAGPYCRVEFSWSRRIVCTDGLPIVRRWVVSPAGVQIAAKGVQSAPDDHLTASPDRRVTVAAGGRVGRAGRVSNYQRWDYIFRRCSKNQRGSSKPPHTIISLPVHTAACRIRLSGALVVLVTVQLSLLGLYFPPVFE